VQAEQFKHSVLQKARLQKVRLFLAITILLTPISLIAQDISSIETSPQISTERKAALVYMVRQDCGSCHGMTLKGGLGPSLLPERISVLPKSYLIEAVTHGRKGTPMPPWEPILTTDEIVWIVEQLQLGQIAQQKP